MMKNTISYQNHTLQVYDFDVIDSRMYMLRQEDQALFVDPCVREELLPALAGVKHGVVYLTHEHYDHIRGVNWLKEQLDCEVVCTACCAERLLQPRLNLSRTFPLLFLQDKEKYQAVREHQDKSYTCAADSTYRGEEERQWMGHTLYMRETPGHSPGSSMLLLDAGLLFSGDSLLGNGMEIKSLGSDAESFKTRVLPYAKSLDPRILVCPGHGEPQELGEMLQKIVEYIG